VAPIEITTELVFNQPPTSGFIARKMMPDGPADPSVFNATDRTSGPVICSYMTGWGSQGRESEETIVDRSTDLASGFRVY